MKDKFGIKIEIGDTVEDLSKDGNNRQYIVVYIYFTPHYTKGTIITITGKRLKCKMVKVILDKR